MTQHKSKNWKAFHLARSLDKVVQANTLLAWPAAECPSPHLAGARQSLMDYRDAITRELVDAILSEEGSCGQYYD